MHVSWACRSHCGDSCGSTNPCGKCGKNVEEKKICVGAPAVATVGSVEGRLVQQTLLPASEIQVRHRIM